MKKQLFSFLLGCCSLLVSAQQPVDYVNPFIGTSNYGTTNPGAICPQGMMSVVPFNVMGSERIVLTRIVNGGLLLTRRIINSLRDLRTVSERRGLSGAGRFAIDADDGRVERGL